MPASKTRKGNLSDREVILQHNKNEKLEIQIARLQKRLTDGKKVIIDELLLRGTHAIENSGTRVTLVQAETVSYDEESLRRRLRAKWKTVTKTVLDRAALSREVQAGNIDPRVVDACSEVRQSKPYYRASDV